MSHRGDKVQPVENKGKRSVFGVERQLPAPTKLQSCPAVVDRFGTTKVYSTDKFGAVQIFDAPCASFGSSLSRRNIDKTEYSTGSFTPVEVDCFENQEGGDQECDDAAALSTKESVWSQYINSSGAATSYTAETAKIFEDPRSNCSTPRSSTVDVASSAGPPIKRFCATLKHDAAPYVPSLPESHGAERCRHVIYPEDLIWASVKNYCGMVLDRETQAVLGTAVLFIPEDPKCGKPAWVTSVNTVEGRTEVLIKNCKGEVHISKLMLTSTAFGLAFFSIHAGRGTFALAFLSMVTGPARLPHRQYVDVDQGDRVYVFGYEEPWESEIGKIADVRVRPGRITDAGNQVSVEIDFTNGQLGGSINSPAGFKGGLVARADGIWAGVITGQNLTSHQTLIDFSPAYNVYSILEEL